MSTWRIARLIAAKDLRIELRSRVVTNQVLPFAALVMVMFAFALDNDSVLTRVAPGLVWLATLFSMLVLVQRAFAAAGIWLPRDAYLQERFCRPVAVRPGESGLLEPGDLIFFGPARRCTHVGLHLGGGRYLHSSGREHGRNGIGLDDLNPRNPDPVAAHYRAELRGAGRVMHSHDGSPLPP